MTARDGIATLIATIHNFKNYRSIAKFFCALLFYVDGMNVAAKIGATSFGWIDYCLGSKKISSSPAGHILFRIPLLLVETKLGFWIAGLPLDLFIGLAQISNCSLVARLAPAVFRTKTLDLFAFFGCATAYIGLFVLGALT